MHVIINATGTTILRGRIVKRTVANLSVCSQLKGGAALAVKTGFPNLIPGATGLITATCVGLTACKLWLRGPGVWANDMLTLPNGTSTITTRNTFTAPLLEVRSDKDPVGTIDLAMTLDDAIAQCADKDSALYAVTAADLPDKGSAQAFIAGEMALVEFVEASVTIGKSICANASGQGRYYDPMKDKGAMVLGQLDSTSAIQMIAGKSYVNLTINPSIP